MNRVSIIKFFKRTRFPKRLSFVMVLFFSYANASVIQNNLPIKQFKINNKIYQIEIAKTRQQLSIGLMGRKNLMANQGMLFVFPQVKRHGIWMKNMSIPITVAWLNEQYTVIDVKKLSPCLSYNCPIYKPSKESSYVLELNVNDGIKIGQKIKIIN